jgi:hypothetical protein
MVEFEMKKKKEPKRRVIQLFALFLFHILSRYINKSPERAIETSLERTF